MNQTGTLQNETLDQVIFRVFGRVNAQLLQLTYNLNPGITDFGLIIPEGIIVNFSDVPTTTEIPTQHLWD
ncbi:hypothetical protein C6497_13880 [Candidatus Poribacteria bacterium]|nr:MAG: hypothetical protein C6497_13880 [Candidatus Poribacteria bacterium]